MTSHDCSKDKDLKKCPIVKHYIILLSSTVKRFTVYAAFILFQVSVL